MLNSSFRRLAVFSTLSLALLAGGCSKASKKAAHLREADQYFVAGDYDRAEIEYRNVIQQAGLDPQAVGRLAEIYHDQGKLRSSAPYLLRGVELQPDNLTLQLKLGYFRVATGQFKEAYDIAGRILERKPDHPEAPILLAEAVMTPDQATEARGKLKNLPAPAPESAPVLAGLAVLDLREEKLPSALELAQRAVKANPKLAVAHGVLARVYWAQKNTAGADQAFATALELAPVRSPLRLQHVQYLLQNGRSEDARKQLATLMQRAPDFLPPYLVNANLLASEKKYDESLALIDKVLAREPEHPEAMLMAAQNRLAKGEADKALVILERGTSADLYAKSPHFQFLLGQAYLAKGDETAATAALNEAAKIDPNLPGPTLALAQLNIRQKNFGPAVVALKAFLQKNPRILDAHLLLADAYQRQGNLDEALSIYRQLSKAVPGNAQFHLLAGTILGRQNKLSEARAEFDQAQKLGPDALSVVEQQVNVDLAARDVAAAKRRVESFIASHPKQPAPYLLLAKIHASQNDNAATEAALKKTIELQPDAPLPYSLLAQLYASTNQIPQAIANAQSAADRSPQDFGPVLFIAMLKEKQKDLAGARASYEKALALNPKAGVTLNNLAYLYAEHFNEVDKAVDLAQRARDLMPNQPETADTLGWVLYRKKQYARAESLLSDAAERLPESPDVLFHSGMASYMMGKEEAARAALEAAVKSDKPFVGIDEAKECLVVLGIDTDKVDAKQRAALVQAIERRKDDPVARARMAAVYEREGKFDEALAAYDAIVKANPANVSASLGLLRVYQARKEPAKALEVGRALRKAAPNDARVAHVVGRLAYESGDYPWSLGLLQDASRRGSDDPELLFDVGQAAYAMGQVANAEAAFNEAVQAAPKSPRVAKAREYLDLIAVAANPGASTAAIAKVDALLKADPNNVPAVVAKAALDEQKGDLKAARQGYEKALNRFPDFNPAKRQLAILLANTGEDPARGAELAAKARETYPSDAAVAKAFGLLLARQGNHARAVTLLQESARTLTNDPVVFFQLGLSQVQTKAAGAKASLQRALQLGLSDAQAAEARQALASAK